MGFLREYIDWIAVGDRLPEDSKSVLVCCHIDGCTTIQRTAHYAGGWLLPSLRLADHVTHWAELPKGPV